MTWAGEIRRLSEAGFDGLAFGMVAFLDQPPKFGNQRVDSPNDFC